MTYASLLVHLQAGISNVALLDAAEQFAERFKAHVVGIAVCQPMMLVSGDGTVCGEVMADDQRQIERDLETSKAEFQQALRGRCAGIEWRSEITIATPASYLADQARAADLIMTGSVPSDTFYLARAMNPGTLVMEAGRPVFIVPSDARQLRFDHALVAWNDTRECRRAAADAMPLLKQFAQVTVLEIAALDELDAAQARTNEVVTWLARHGVMAKSRVERSTGSDVGHLQALADEASADVIVAGAYGHSRLREWAVGGVTRNLLLESRRGVLVSH